MVQPRDVVDQWAAAYNACDAEAAADLYEDNASNWQLAIGSPVIGRDAIRKGFLAFFQAFPDSAIRTEALLEAGNIAVWTWVASGTWQGAFAGLPPNGKAYTLRGCSLFEVAGGRITSQRAYWDRATWFRQLDIPI
jgi:steroid delta-isomerase-like uncharacterized protein